MNRKTGRLTYTLGASNPDPDIFWRLEPPLYVRAIYCGEVRILVRVCERMSHRGFGSPHCQQHLALIVEIRVCAFKNYRLHKGAGLGLKTTHPPNITMNARTLCCDIKG